MHHQDMTQIVVLSDGETYTDRKGCTIRYVPENIFDDEIEHACRANELEAEPVLSASDVADVAENLIASNPEFAPALKLLCENLRLARAS